MFTLIAFFAVIGAFVVGCVAGSTVISYHHSRRECRECRKRMAEYGFHVGRKEYRCVERKESEADR